MKSLGVSAYCTTFASCREPFDICIHLNCKEVKTPRVGEACSFINAEAGI